MYRLYPNSHMFQGVLKPHTTLIKCQQACLEERNCLGIDWNKLDSPAGNAADDRRCFFVFPESTRYGVQPSTDYCCDHYRRTYCLSTVVPGGGQSSVTQSPVAKSGNSPFVSGTTAPPSDPLNPSSSQVGLQLAAG